MEGISIGLFVWWNSFQDSSNIDFYRRDLGHHTIITKNLEKIWLFTKDEIHVDILDDTRQQMIVRVQYKNWREDILFTLIYVGT